MPARSTSSCTSWLRLEAAAVMKPPFGSHRSEAAVIMKKADERASSLDPTPPAVEAAAAARDAWTSA